MATSAIAQVIHVCVQAETVQQHLTVSASRCKELEWELQHLRDYTSQSEQTHKAALQDIQNRLTAAKAESQRFEQDAVALKSGESTAHSEAAHLAQELGEVKVKPHAIAVAIAIAVRTCRRTGWATVCAEKACCAKQQEAQATLSLMSDGCCLHICPALFASL